ncbi:MAG: aminopeptidase P family protein [Candidatus Micrarchaeota archaeon]|nr:aminopeptidase P family protein [Candidatus Micrarchaeota archaeon]
MAQTTIKNRLKKIFDNAPNVDVIFLANLGFYIDPNFSYITGYTRSVYESNLLLLTREEAFHITTPLDYGDALLEKHPEISVVLASKSGAHLKLLSKLLKGKRVGINGSFLDYSLYLTLKKHYKPKRIADVTDAFDIARVVKEPEEVEHIRQAVRITKWAMLQIQRDFKEGVTEREIAAKFEYISQSLGSQRTVLQPVVCFGKNSALPHHVPDDTKLKKGDFVLIDACAAVNNYYSDISRTFIFGEGSEQQKEMYRIVQEAKIKATRAIKPGANPSKIFKIAKGYIEKAEGGKYKKWVFNHGLGHSLGLEEHDSHHLSSLDPHVTKPLLAGSVVTVEPGIYIPDFGGVRIEDDVLITEDGEMIL